MDVKSSTRRRRGRSAAVAPARPPLVAPRRPWRGLAFGRVFVPLLVIAIMLVVAYDLYLVGSSLS